MQNQVFNLCDGSLFIFFDHVHTLGKSREESYFFCYHLCRLPGGIIHNIIEVFDIFWPCKVIILIEIPVSSYLFTHPAGTEQHYSLSF